MIADPEATRDADVTHEVGVEGWAGVQLPPGRWHRSHPPGRHLAARLHPEGDAVAVVLWVYDRVATEGLFASGRLRASGPEPSLGPRFKEFGAEPLSPRSRAAPR